MAKGSRMTKKDAQSLLKEVIALVDVTAEAEGEGNSGEFHDPVVAKEIGRRLAKQELAFGRAFKKATGWEATKYENHAGESAWVVETAE